MSAQVDHDETCSGHLCGSGPHLAELLAKSTNRYFDEVGERLYVQLDRYAHTGPSGERGVEETNTVRLGFHAEGHRGGLRCKDA